MFKKYFFVHSIGRNAVLQIVVVLHHKRFSFSYTCTWIWLAPSNIMPYNYSPCSERDIWPFFESRNISETGEDTPAKIYVQALDINTYLHKFFEPIPID